MIVCNKNLLIFFFGAFLQSCFANSSNNSSGTNSLPRADIGDASQTRIRRLTTQQYKNIIADTFEGRVKEPTTAFVDVAMGGLPTAGAGYVGMPATDAEAFSVLAATVSAQVVSSENRDALSCRPADAKDKDCLRQLIEVWGKRLTRRPLSANQLNRYLDLAIAQALSKDDAYQGLQVALSAILQSPFFLFQADTVSLKSSDKTMLDDYSIASRLSFLIVNRGPDDLLLAAADAGQLSTTQQRLAHADRLLASSAADTGLYNFLMEMLSLDKILTVAKDPNDFSPQLRSDLETQIHLTVTDLLLSQNGDYRTLFTTKSWFVNSALAKQYNFPDPGSTAFAKVNISSDDRSGLFGMPGMGAALTPVSRSSPTKRGEFIRNAVLCTAVPMPPANVNTTVDAGAAGNQTLRQVMVAHATNPECNSCHHLMDPIGFGLEGFDYKGLARTTDNGQPIDTSGELDGVTFANATGMGSVLASNPQVVKCLVQKFLLYATGTSVSFADTIAVKLENAMATNRYQIKSLVRSWVADPSFAHAG